MNAVRRLAAVVALGASAVALPGCGGAAGTPPPTAAPVSADQRLVPEAYTGRYRASASVLESPGHGPQLCYTMAESMPPQCGGPDVLGWDWAAVPAESAAGTTWGEYELVGTFADGAFALTEPAVVRDPGAGQGGGPPEVDRFATPCPEPAGGWVPPDPALATEAAAEEARAVARSSPGFAVLWIDQRIPDAEIAEQNANDPQRYVLNTSTTGDIAALDAALRRVWGGSLCVSAAPRSEAELLAVQAALPELPGSISSGLDALAGVVDLSVVHGTLEQQQALDEEFGPGVVRLSSSLEPID